MKMITSSERIFMNNNNNSNFNDFVVLNGIIKRYSDITAVNDLDISVGKGEFFSLLGPSGCGKTTTLRLIAGLDCLSGGSISIDGKLVSDPTFFIPPEKRAIGIVFQDYALFPHMNVFENVAFGLYGQNKSLIAKRVSELLTLTGLSGMDKKYPHELSGGQRQRVALARSLAPAPKVMLLDEPFSNLDAELRESLRNETKQILKESGTTVILVTHDQEEAFSLSDRVGLLNAGRLEQVGTPYEVYHNPASRFVADFVGKADFIPAFAEGDYIVSGIGRFLNNKSYCLNASKVDLMIRPDDVLIEADPHGEAVIEDMRFLGSDVLYRLRLNDNIFIHSIGLSAFPIPAGTKVKVSINMPHTVFFPVLN